MAVAAAQPKAQLSGAVISSLCSEGLTPRLIKSLGLCIGLVLTGAASGAPPARRGSLEKEGPIKPATEVCFPLALSC